MRLAALVLTTACLVSAQVRLPDYQRQVQPNGMVLDLIVRKDVPMISLRAIARGGSEADPPGKAGLGAVVGELLRRGTPTRTADQFSEQLDFIGASMNVRVDEQAASVSSEFLAKDAAAALDLFADAVSRPTFPPDEVKKVLAQRIDAAKAVKDNPGVANSYYFRPFFFPSAHPYSRQPAGDETSLAAITRDDIVSHHRRFYSGKNLILIAAGDLPQGFAEKITSAFSSIAAGEAYAWIKNAPLPAYKSPRLLLIDKPDATQTYFLIAQPGIHRTHPDRVALWLVNTLFGGRFTSMLNDELRVNSGLTYGARSQVQQDRLPGAILINSYTRTDTTGQAIDLALTVLRRLRENGIDAEQLASAKAYLKGTYPPEFLETSDQLANVLGDIELHDLNRAEVDDLFSRIDRVTAERATAVARRYIGEENLQFCLLGNAAKIKDAVKKYAREIRVVPISEPGFTP